MNESEARRYRLQKWALYIVVPILLATWMFGGGSPVVAWYRRHREYTQNHYLVRWKCTNCGATDPCCASRVWIPKGTALADGLARVPCDDCGFPLGPRK